MAKLNYSMTVSVDTRNSTIHYLSMVGEDIATVNHHIKHYNGSHFDDAFFAGFKAAIAEFSSERPSESVGKICLVLPDNAVVLDTVNVPTMRSRSATRSSLDAALGKIYKNIDDLKVQANAVAQNKQYTTFSVAAVQKRLLTSLYSACAENKLLVDAATFSSSSAAAALSVADTSLKCASYLLLDVKDSYSVFTFVVGGRAAGSYTLPFGLDFLGVAKFIQEDMLFDHRVAELAVLNSREKAKAKRTYTSITSDATIDTGDEHDEDDAQELVEDGAVDQNSIENDSIDREFDQEDVADDESDDAADDTAEHEEAPRKYMAAKAPRRLPKFMQRDIPETREGIACENFRVFVKWALSLLAANKKTVALGAPDCVLVNIPEELGYVIDSANAEEQENGISFRRLVLNGVSDEYISNLELYGGLFPKSIHTANKF